MTLQVIPNIEAVLYDWLGDHPSITALGARVAGSLPSAQSEQVAPWVKVTQLDAADIGGVEHLIDCLVQFDCYAGATATNAHVGQTEASRLARTVRAVLKALEGEVCASVVISSVTFAGMARVPDTAFKTPRERFILTAAIHCHA